jgi:hypothetical protein
LHPAPPLRVNDPDTDESNASVVDELTEHQLLLLCPQALAFALKHKQWSESYCFYPIANFSLTPSNSSDLIGSRSRICAVK